MVCLDIYSHVFAEVEPGIARKSFEQQLIEARERLLVHNEYTKDTDDRAAVDDESRSGAG